VLPTGGGKTLTYLLPLLDERRHSHVQSAALVVTPTISLMTDMVASIDDLYRAEHHWDLKAHDYNSNVSDDRRRLILEEFRRGDVDLLFVSPETMLRSYFLSQVLRVADRIAFFVVDEAHLVADWGRQFRPDFQRLGYVRRRLLEANPSIRTHLMSVTVSHETEELLRRVFDVDDALWRTARHCPLREEAFISVEDAGQTREASLAWLRGHLTELELPALVYVTVREHAELLAREIRERGLRAAAYHGETPPEERELVVRQWRDSELDVVVGTSAFGLGIDKPNVGTVVHLCLPESLDRLYQEIGRAGRDGRRCGAFLVSVGEDVGIARGNSLKLLTIEKLIGRWGTLLAKGVEIGWEGPDPIYLLNESSVPSYWRPELGLVDARGHNQLWNQCALNFLQRCGFVEYRGSVLSAVRGRIRRVPDQDELSRFDVLGEHLAKSEPETELAISLRRWSKDRRGPIEAIAADIEQLATSGFFEIHERQHGSLFRVDVRFVRHEVGTEDQLGRLREIELNRARRSMDQAIHYARGSDRSQCLRRPFAETYDVPFGRCGNCEVCVQHGWSATAAYRSTPPRPWDREDSPVRGALAGKEPEHVVFEPQLAERHPAGQLRLVPVLAYCGVKQFVVPAGWNQRGIGVLHTLESVWEDRALLERLPTAMYIPSQLSPNHFRGLVGRITRLVSERFFTMQTPVIWVIDRGYVAMTGGERSFLENRQTYNWEARVLVEEAITRDGYRYDPRDSLNVELKRTGWPHSSLTPVESDDRRGYWIEVRE
jgi:hypothetical protein